MVNHNQPNGFQKAMRSICEEGGYDELNPGIEGFNQKAIILASKLKPDIIFCQIQKENILNPSTAIVLAKNSFVINWTGDVRTNIPMWMVEIGKFVQLTAFSNMVDVENFQSYKLNADYLKIGFDPEKYKKHNTIKQTPSIVAHFNNYGKYYFPLSQYRIDIVNRLKQEFRSEFGLFGRMEGSIGDFNHDQVAESINYNNAKIAINCSHFNYDRYSSDRLKRILGSGCFCLSHDFTNIDIDYEIEKHLDVFYNLDDLVAKCYFYLRNKDIREQIANEGYKLAHEKYTFKNMCENIILLYQKYNGRK